MTTLILLLVFIGLIAIVAVLDVTQQHDPVRRNFPVVGHGRNILKSLGPKLRQYIVAGNDDERPFTRDQREWVDRSSEKKNNYFGFGTDNKIDSIPNYLIIKHSAFPINEKHANDPGYDPQYRIPCSKVLGGYRQRRHAFRPASIVSTSAMSYGSLSPVAVQAINGGCKLAGCLQNTGEGGVSPHHDHGGELIWQIGTGYFGCRNPETGEFSLDRFLETVQRYPVRVIEVKLSQGAKPGKGGVLPAAKITPEISKIRGIPMGRDCISPSSHTAFSNVDQMLDFVEMLADKSGLPVGIKSAVGQMEFWHELASGICDTGRAVDYIAIDGGEGGTGAAPLVFADHVALPFYLAFSRVHKIFVEAGLRDKIVFCGSGKLGFPQNALFAFALGCDLIAVGREAMMAIGCIQAQECHTGFCPTGVATQRKWLMRGLQPGVKSHNLANYLVTLRKELLHLSWACGQPHPALVTTDHLEIINRGHDIDLLLDSFDRPQGNNVSRTHDHEAIKRMMDELP